MTWTYVQQSGHLYAPDGTLLGTGYSGNGADLNNPAGQADHGHGPCPCGLFTIGPARDPVDHLGPLAMPLTPNAGTEMFGRSGIFIHGDNAAGNHSASDGCIILGHDFRQAIDDSEDDQLCVVATEADVAALAANERTET